MKITNIILIIWFCIFPVFTHSADVELKHTEYEIKAAYLYNFFKFIELEDDKFTNLGDTIRITILGNDPFGNLFDSFEGKLIKGKKLEISRITQIKDLKNSQIIYVSNLEKNNIDEIFDTLKKTNSLIVGESEKFIHLGGIICFVLDKDQVSIVINLDAAERSKITINTQLLQIAQTVRD